MKLRYVILAEKVIIENTVTVVNIIDGLSFVPPTVSEDPSSDMIAFRIPLCLLMSWEIESPEEADSPQSFTLRVRRPNRSLEQSKADALTRDFSFQGQKLLNLRFYIPGINYTGDGRYVFEICDPRDDVIVYGTWSLQLIKLDAPLDNPKMILQG